MSKITFDLSRLDVREKGNYFVLIQLDSTDTKTTITNTIKYRTEIDYATQFPQFQKT